MVNLSWLLIAAVGLTLCDSYKILVVFPMPSKSHGILGSGVVKHLLKAGHEVTYVTPFQEKNPPPNLHYVDVSNEEQLEVQNNLLNVTALLEGTVSIDLNSMITLILDVNKHLLTNPNLEKLMSDTSKNFDVVIGEWLFSEMASGIGYLFNCPFIWVSTVEPHWMVLSLIDENTHPAYVADAQSDSVIPFNFASRVKELFLQLIGKAIGYLYMDGQQQQMFEELLGPHILKRGKPMVTFDSVKYNASLMLGNSHVSLGQATRLPQSYIPIAGYHIDAVVKPLPNDLKKLLDNAKNGLIYFSMGSNLKSKELPEVLKKDLLELFGSLKQTVLWKFEEVLPNLPSNVHIIQWAPQQSILAHPNCNLFITHGGLLSTTEAVHFGKPIIGIPVFGDQFNNIDRAVKKGFAKRVDLAYDMKHKLKAAIDEVLNNKSYAEKVKQLSFIYHDRPVHPGKELVHWVEHVVKTSGAPHLRSPALDVPLYQKLYLDLLVLVLAILYVLKKIIVKLFCSRKAAEKKKKNN